jgi:hypothetical protein
LLIAAPNLRLAGSTELKTDRFTEPVGEATSAQVTLDLWSSPTHIFALSGSENLIDVEATYTGTINFNASGGQTKTIRLDHESEAFGPFFWMDAFGRERLDIGLNPETPLALTIDSGSGSVDLDLEQLQLESLNLGSGSGSIDLNLPSTGSAYAVETNTGSGSVSVDVPSGAQVDLQIDSGSGAISVAIAPDAQANLQIESGSGSVSVDVPENAAVRVEVRDSGSGNVRVPSGYTQVQSGDDEDEGVWESPNFSGAAAPVVIVVDDVGSGSLNVR